MKIIIQSLMFIVIVGLFAVTSDRLGKIEQKEAAMGNSSEVKMSDAEFLDNAIPHHEGAVVMAQSALVNSKRPEVKEFAQLVIAGETESIAKLYEWRRDWYGKTDRIFLDKVDRKVSMVEDLGGADAEFDLRFLNAMIDHHEGAIQMLGEILIPTTRPEIHSVATGDIVALGKDVEIMREWRRDWYGK